MDKKTIIVVCGQVPSSGATWLQTCSGMGMSRFERRTINRLPKFGEDEY
jgi:hypothetical protein